MLACIILSAAMAHAQYRASLRGTVADPQGAVIAGATVTLIDIDTNKTMVSTSDGNGIYNFNALPPAPYRITVEHDGFTKKVLEHVQIIPEQLNSLDLQLEVGQVSQTVTVSAHPRRSTPRPPRSAPRSPATRSSTCRRSIATCFNWRN